MSSGLEFDVELAQHTAVDVLPSGDAETEPGCDGMSEVRKRRKGAWCSSTGGLPRWSGAPPSCHLRKVSGDTGPKSSSTNYSPGECCKRATCHGHALDKTWKSKNHSFASSGMRMYARFVGSVFGSADVTRLRFSGTGATVDPPVATAAFQVATNVARRE